MRVIQTARAVRSACAIALLFIVAAPLHAQNFVPAPNFACAPGSPSKDTSASAFLKKLLGSVQYAWSDPSGPQAAKNIDPLAPPGKPDIGTGNQVSSCPSNAGVLCFDHLGLTTCEHITTNYNVSNYTGLSKITVTSIDVSSFNLKDVATHGAWGPDAGKVTDGVFAPEGTTWNNPSFTTIITNAGEAYAVTVDLGSALTICGSSTCAPYVQADRHNMELDWWDDANQKWQVWGGTCESSGSGLTSRKVIPSATPGNVKCGTTANGSNFTTRYVRLWALPGADDSNFSVSEIQLKDANSNIVSTGKVAIGSRPYVITDGVFAKEGSTWDDKNYAVVLRNDGAANALVVDLGGIVSVCGVGSCQPTIQADKNIFYIDYSLDGLSWVRYAQLPTASGDGLRTRNPVVTNSKITSSNPNFNARYVRIWGCSTTDCPDSINNDFSVSEVQLNNASGTNVSKGALTFGAEGVATNGDPTADSSNVDWNDPRFTTILSPCLSSAPKCVQSGSAVPVTGPLFVDLTAAFPISKIVFQGDRHPFQVDYLDESVTPPAWKALWSIPHTTTSGLSSREFAPPVTQARHLMIYGTQDSNDPDSNYSVSSVRIFTQVANTSCGYASGANYGQTFACSYDAPPVTQLTVPTGLNIGFTIDSASSHLYCTNGTSSDTWTAIKYPDGTTCNATISIGSQPSGGYCSGACSSGDFVATNVNLDAPVDPQKDPPTFLVTGLNCNHTAQAQDSQIPSSAVQSFTNGLITFVQQIAAEAVTGLFNGIVSSGLTPSGACATTIETPNTTLDGSATQVGSNNDSGHIRLSGEADIAASTRLDAVAFTLEQILFERGGVEELVRNGRRSAFAPLTLELQNGSKPDRAVYATAPSRVPSARAELSRTKTGSMAFTVEIDRARMPTLPNCTGASPTAELATRFTLDDGAGSTTIRARQRWLCQGTQLRTL